MERDIPIYFLDLIILHAIQVATRELGLVRQRQLLRPREREGAINDILRFYRVDPWRQKPLASVSTFTRSIAKMRRVGLIEPRYGRSPGFVLTDFGHYVLEQLGDDPHTWPRVLPFGELDGSWLPVWNEAIPFLLKPDWTSQKER